MERHANPKKRAREERDPPRAAPAKRRAEEAPAARQKPKARPPLSAAKPKGLWWNPKIDLTEDRLDDDEPLHALRAAVLPKDPSQTRSGGGESLDRADFEEPEAYEEPLVRGLPPIIDISQPPPDVDALRHRPRLWVKGVPWHMNEEQLRKALAAVAPEITDVFLVVREDCVQHLGCALVFFPSGKAADEALPRLDNLELEDRRLCFWRCLGPLVKDPRMPQKQALAPKAEKQAPVEAVISYSSGKKRGVVMRAPQAMK
eukprot:m51a1_g25 hypothetical protein (259) ;mRNA; r:107184-108006